jgi:hypothetical protein
MWLNGNAINYDPLNVPNSQNLPELEALNFGFTLTEREVAGIAKRKGELE